MSLRDLIRRDLRLPAGDRKKSPSVVELERGLGRPVVKLDTNENPYGASPRAAQALARCNAARYPDPECAFLRLRLGEYLGFEPEYIVCSAGGDEMIDLLLRLFLEPGDEVIDCTPSFVMYERSTTFNHGVRVRVPRDECFAVDVSAVERAVGPRTKVIFLCSPNNPTGNPTPHEDLQRLLSTGRIVVLDEAYAEFAGRTLVGMVREHPNLIVTRTMSKWAGLAGLRLGYAIAQPEVVTHLGTIKSPYNVSVAAQVAGVVSLEDRAYLMKNVARILAERERLRDLLTRLDRGTVYPSETNFLYWAIQDGTADTIKLSLARRGVLIRSFHDPRDALRISIGRPADTASLMLALQDSYAEIES